MRATIQFKDSCFVLDKQCLLLVWTLGCSDHSNILISVIADLICIQLLHGRDKTLKLNSVKLGQLVKNKSVLQKRNTQKELFIEAHV